PPATLFNQRLDAVTITIADNGEYLTGAKNARIDAARPCRAEEPDQAGSRRAPPRRAAGLCQYASLPELDGALPDVRGSLRTQRKVFLRHARAAHDRGVGKRLDRTKRRRWHRAYPNR